MRLADLFDHVIERSPPSDAVVLSVSERFGVIPQERLFTKKIALDDKSKYLCVQPGDVVYNSYLLWNGAVGVCFDKRGGCTSPAYVVLRPKHKGVQRFLHYFLRSVSFTSAVGAIASGSVTRRRTAPVEDILNLEFKLPQLPDQRTANSLLCDIDDKIELNRCMNETLEAITRAMFRSWFVDFDPVRAKMSGEPPESICQRLGLTPDLLALFPDRLVDSEHGEIPEGWEVTKVQVATSKIFSGGTPDTRKAEYWGSELNWCSSGETRNRFVIETEKKITQSGVDNSSTKAVVPSDILIASAGQGHTRGQTSYCAIDMFINQSVISVRANTEKAKPLWLFYNLASRYEEMRGLSDSHSSRGSLTTKLIGGMDLILPPLRLVKAFDDITGPLAHKQIEGAQQSVTLSMIRDVLLPKLISGELRVPSEIEEVTA